MACDGFLNRTRRADRRSDACFDATREKYEQARASDACGQEVRTDFDTREDHREILSSYLGEPSKMNSLRISSGPPNRLRSLFDRRRLEADRTNPRVAHLRRAPTPNRPRGKAVKRIRKAAVATESVGALPSVGSQQGMGMDPMIRGIASARASGSRSQERRASCCATARFAARPEGRPLNPRHVFVGSKVHGGKSPTLCRSTTDGRLRTNSVMERPLDLEPYARTRAFYEARGFTPLEEQSTLSGEENPCLIYLKVL